MRKIVLAGILLAALSFSAIAKTSVLLQKTISAIEEQKEMVCKDEACKSAFLDLENMYLQIDQVLTTPPTEERRQKIMPLIETAEATWSWLNKTYGE